MELVPHTRALEGGDHHEIHQLALELLDHSSGDLGLGREVVVERPPGDAGPFGDLVATGGRETLLGEELSRRLEEGPAGAGGARRLGLPWLAGRCCGAHRVISSGPFTCGPHACYLR